MKKSRFNEEQIIGFLKRAEAGMPVKELCRKGGFSDATFYKWRAWFGGTDVQVAVFRGYPKAVRTDNRSEFTSRAFIGSAQTKRIGHMRIHPGEPDAERLHRKL